MTTNEACGNYVTHSGLNDPLEYGPMNGWPFNPGEQRYVSLATYRRNGVEVRTPVWIAESEGKYYLFSEGEAGKVKRLRANGKVRKERAYKALRRKYGWQMKMIDFFSRIGGRYNQRAIIELEIIA